MKIDWFDVDENNPYYEVEIWSDKGGLDSFYFTTFEEAKKCLTEECRKLLEKGLTINASNCIKHHFGERRFWNVEVISWDRIVRLYR